MLEELSVENLLIIDGLKVPLHPRLNVISGETGVGKSLLLAAIGALFGERIATPTLPDRELRIEGRFAIDAETRRRLPDSLVDGTDDQLIVRISKKPGGSQRTWVNGNMASRQELRALGEVLVDVHGQHDMQRLLSEKEQVDVLDAFAGTTAERVRFTDVYRRLEETKRRLSERAARLAILRDRLELTRFQSEELDDAAPRVGEHDELSRAFRLAARQAETVAALEAARTLLDGDDGGIHDSLIRAGRVLERQSDDDGAMNGLAERAFAVADLARDLAGDIAGLGRDRSRGDDGCETVAPRLDLLNHLLRKYKTDESGLVEKRERLRLEVAESEAEVAGLVGLDGDLGELEAELRRIGGELAHRRHVAGESLARRIETEFKDLRLSDARFAVESGWNDGRLSEHVGAGGFGRPRFAIRANPGSDWADLATAASGGELARVMLALKSVLAEAHGAPILVFDEIESGVGPRLGTILGRRLAVLSRHHQIICITHLPQIAAFADRHLKITKSITGDVTRTRVDEVEGASRIEEIAAMLGGGDDRLARRQAKSLLEEASRDDAVAGSET